jgi:predicted O-methyltransferase YrrM
MTTADDASPVLDKADALSQLLSPDSTRNRDEPEIAGNIGAQLQHMGLSTWSISAHRRLRDALGRLKPNRIIEVGGGIGHRSAWIYDLFTVDGFTPERYDIIENGAKFAVIIHRLMTRFEAESYTKIVVGVLDALVGETLAWKAASSTGLEAGDAPIQPQADAIIVDGISAVRAKNVEMMLPFLAPGGVLFTLEPDMPVGDVDPEDADGMALVEGFNAWIELIQSCNESHHVAFMPLFGGTLVAMVQR